MYLENINSPVDVKKLKIEQLNELSKEIREALLEKLSEHGGHIAPNLGMVELSVALHYVFNSPEDKIVFDVSHQSYVHKMLTGRLYAFTDKNRYDDVTGYSCPDESEHDFFTIGHTSTSVSLACGLAKARDLKGEKGNVIAIIGDGSLSGGEAYEGLNNIVENGTNTIVIVNDNEMSIAENYGGLYKNLALLRESNGNCPDNFFKSLGFEYRYIDDGHDYIKLIEVLKSVKDSEKPVVVHVHTIKGKGLSFAEEDKERYHFGMPFDRKTGEDKFSFDGENYNDLTGDFLYQEMKKNQNLVAITSGTPGIYGYNKEKRTKIGKQLVDVGIAEEHAVAMASAIAKNGGTPVYAVYSSFIQRAYDQLSQDLCINNNPATILVFAGSVWGMNDKTHLGLFDIAMLSNIPNLIYLAPTCKEEYFAMLKYSITQKSNPVVIRVPGNGVISSGKEDATDYSLLNKFELVRRGKDVAIIGVGSFFQLAEEVADNLKSSGINASLINPKFVSGIDENMLDKLKAEHKVVITLEDGIIEGGFGQKIASYYGTSDIKVKNYGIKKSFPDRYNVDQLLEVNNLTSKQIIEDVLNLLKK